MWASGVVNNDFKCGEFGTEQKTEHRHLRVRSTLTVVVVIGEKDLRIFERRRKWFMREPFEALYQVLWSKVEKVNIFFFKVKKYFF